MKYLIFEKIEVNINIPADMYLDELLTYKVIKL